MEHSFDTPRQEDPHARLERAFIDEFLHEHHLSLETLHQLPASEAARVLSQASVFASGRLSELESRAHLMDELHRTPSSFAPSQRRG